MFTHSSVHIGWPDLMKNLKEIQLIVLYNHCTSTFYLYIILYAESLKAINLFGFILICYLEKTQIWQSQWYANNALTYYSREKVTESKQGNTEIDKDKRETVKDWQWNISFREYAGRQTGERSRSTGLTGKARGCVACLPQHYRCGDRQTKNRNTRIEEREERERWNTGIKSHTVKIKQCSWFSADCEYRHA